MSRLTIDTGTAGNPATGDSLRTAFTKVNTNFEELYAELGADGSLSDLNFTDNIISTDNTNQNIILSPNGTGLIDVDNRRIINVADPTSAQDAATKAYVDAQNVAQAITFVGDDSTGTAVNSGETFKIAGSGSVTTAVSGDTITITGATTNLGDFTFSGNKLSTTSSNADMELDTAGTGNLVLKSGNFLPATDNTQYLGSADKRWHTLYVGPGSINVNGVSITESGGKISLGNSTSISGTLEVNEITSADSSAIQINDGVNISGNVHLQGNTITLGNITESSIDQSLTTIYGAFGLYDHSGNYSMAMSMSVPGYAGGGGQMIFEGNNSSGYALVPSNNNQYTLGRPEVAGPGTGGYWKNLYTYAINFPDETEQTTAARFTVTGDDSTSNPITAGQQLFILGGTNISTAVVGSTVTINGPDLSSYATTTYVDNKVGENNTLTIKDDTSTSISINLDNTLEVLGSTGISTSVSGSTLTITGPNLSSYLTAVPKTIDVNEISSSDSSAIQINDAVNISGALTANVINIGNMVIGTVPGDITADADTGINFNVSGPDGGFVVSYLKEVGNNNTSGGELSFSSETGNATYRISLSDDMDDGFATKIWRFDGTGTITFPDSTTQNTAFTTDPTLNVLKIDDGVHERFQAKTDATGTVQHNCALGHIFYHTSPDADWTANFTNLNLSSGYATAVTLVIVQGGTGYYPSAVQIGGAAQTLNWQGNTTPTPSTNRTDVVTFSIINNSGTYTVLGQLTGF